MASQEQITIKPSAELMEFIETFAEASGVSEDALVIGAVVLVAHLVHQTANNRAVLATRTYESPPPGIDILMTTVPEEVTIALSRDIADLQTQRLSFDGQPSGGRQRLRIVPPKARN